MRSWHVDADIHMERKGRGGRRDEKADSIAKMTMTTNKSKE